MKERRIIDQFGIEELIDGVQNINLKDIEYAFSIELKNGKKFWVDIIGKKHDVDEKGNKTNLTLCFHEIYTRKEINYNCTNYGCWTCSKLRKWLNEEFFDLLPDWLQKKIVPVVKKTSEDGKIVETVEKIFIPSEIEVFGKTKYSEKGEGKQYEFFKDWHNRIKGLEKDKCSTCYWLRSPISGSHTYFCDVSSSGYYTNSNAYSTRGVAPCFAI